MTAEFARNFKTLSIRQAKSIKRCSAQTLYNNRDKFDWEGSRILNNAKFKNWKPVLSHTNKKYQQSSKETLS